LGCSGVEPLGASEATVGIQMADASKVKHADIADRLK
jgi:hypothetical protein